MMPGHALDALEDAAEMARQFREIHAGESFFEIIGHMAGAGRRRKFGPYLTRETCRFCEVFVEDFHEVAAVFGVGAHGIQGVVAVMGHGSGGLFQSIPGEGDAAVPPRG